MDTVDLAMLFKRRSQSTRHIRTPNNEANTNGSSSPLSEKTFAAKNKTTRTRPGSSLFVSVLRQVAPVSASFCKKKRCRAALKIAILFLLFTRCIVRPLQLRYFGDGYTMEGGRLGATWDRKNRRKHRQWIQEKRRKRLADDLGLVLPPFDQSRNQKYLTVTSEILAKRTERRRMLDQVEQSVEGRERFCAFTSRQQGGQGAHVNSTATTPVSIFPRLILQPNYAYWFRPLRQTSNTTWMIVPFDESDMHDLVRETCPWSLLQVYERRSNNSQFKLHLWTLCALYKYGGYIFGPSAFDDSTAAFSRNKRVVDDELIRRLFLVNETTFTIHTNAVVHPVASCGSIAALVVSNGTQHQLDLVAFAATPQHPMLLCAIRRLVEHTDTSDDNDVLDTLLHIFTSHGRSSDSGSSTRHVVTLNCPERQERQVASSRTQSCCDDEKTGQGVDGSDESTYPRMFVQVVHNDKEYNAVVTPLATVSVLEETDTPPPMNHAKIALRNVMKESQCQAGWRCNRCLHNPFYGTYTACESVCEKCYLNLIYQAHPKKRDVIVNVVVRHRRHQLLSSDEQQIPRIVHQTWMDDVTVDRYPQLARVQSSWRNTGYDYRFYTDADARDYIVSHFPSRFLQAFDSLVPGAFKADLFRLLVLLREGGIYADIDVLAGANLNLFVTPLMSFFAPLDLVGADHDEQFCLWNGLVGASPGHPIVVKAVEGILNRVLNRADEQDFEHELFRDGVGKSLNIWKLRQGRLLLLSGPCALGVAANQVMGRSNPVEQISPGWLTSERIDDNDIGDVLILKGDKFDMNAFRFTDIERNLIVASTDMIDLTTSPFEVEEYQQDNLRKPAAPHYSEIEAMDDVFGSKGVYVDDLVSNEGIKLRVLHEYIDL